MIKGLKCLNLDGIFSKMQNSPVEGFFHYGLAVNNFERFLDFFSNVLQIELVSQREINADYLSELVNSSQVTAQLAMFKFQNGGYFEILKWSTRPTENANLVASLVGVGTSHLCLHVTDVDTLYENLMQLSYVEEVSKGVVSVTTGPNIGARVAFVLVDKLLYLELFQGPGKRN